ncbi:sphingosine-1-phosphate lyase [Sabethes cyaneus]|uniref:sphingosine-1-phosphate lyase n=1 Tax=Sabethes cyaneus TaxID=53552 RepID=UPI00237DCA4D|nr:sphingosine-1-phosphate lyase [Sabethes cyaneus]XP_053692156.1 sphingosine-1-phosphate lyase [Sabethes cyaneus]XP_053692164.1 sphingosine-1-phosphate lyase [Sabethes cyaneus]XP_053692171.1 sphingosine-1-phosphate lyase [Sabethes cyaneus]
MLLKTHLDLITGPVDRALAGKAPWQIVAITTTTVLSAVWLWELLSEDESLYSRIRRRFFKIARKLPAVQRKIDGEIKKINDGFVREASQYGKFTTVLPQDGLTDEQILQKVDDYLALGHYKWKEGFISGAVYYYNPKLVKLVTDVYGKASYTNPLHADVFPGICKMEAEVVRMTATLFSGGSNACGTMTTGGTESIMMACKAYRDYGRSVKGITKPNIVLPKTAHTAFDKSAKYFGMYTKTVPVNRETTEVDLRAMERAINRNTVMLVGSAPNYPYGTMDDIVAIAKLGKKYNIPVHVDACLGGFLIIFMKRAGYQIKPFDFSVDGVTSISADTHKYGFTPKGSSVILYSDKIYRHHQYTVTTEWPGGVYGSPTVNGSRAGGIIAATWATMMNFGLDGYVESTKRIIDTTRYIEQQLRKISNIYLFGTPATSVIAIGSKDFDIYRLSSELNALGWNLNSLQFPSGIHICVTYMHTQDGIADKFVNDVQSKVALIMQNPEKPVEGKMAIYGVAQAVPDREVIGDFTKCFIDSMYYTVEESK